MALIACAVVAVGCGGNDDGVRREVSTPSTPRTADTAGATMTSSPPASTSARSTAGTSEATPAVLAAAVLYRMTSAHERFNTFHVVQRLGHADAAGMITGLDRGPRMTGPERAAIEEALAPRTVHWVASPEAVRGDDPTPKTIPERHAVITIAVPTIDGDRAEVATALWCGFSCTIGGISILEPVPDGSWTVTGEDVFYVS